jgi:hypothetical protein
VPRYGAAVTEPPSYYALRACPSPSAEIWWSDARERHDAPAVVLPLLRGRMRVEVSSDEASSALTWARSLHGWADADPKPLHVYPAADTG